MAEPISTADSGEAAVVHDAKAPRGKKRKVALFFAYVGAGYSGMQYNPNANTLEGVMRAAIHRAGGISDDNANDFNKISWTRAARTDKGVSAVGQVVSLKLLIDGDDSLLDRINQELPPEVRALGAVRVVAGFDARRNCDRRRYEYLLPASAFDPLAFRDRTSVAQDAAAQDAEAGGGAGATGSAPERAPPSAASELPVPQGTLPNEESDRSQPGVGVSASTTHQLECHQAEDGTVLAGGGSTSCNGAASRTCPPPELGAGPPRAPGSPTDGPGGTRAGESPGTSRGPSNAEGAFEFDEGQQRHMQERCTRTFVFDEVQERRLNEVLAQFEGTHDFHNFTARLPSNDPSAVRYILSFKCGGRVQLEVLPTLFAAYCKVTAAFS
eukprot:jgi/Botrbrau1/3943/Bobra.0365s0018.1